MQKSKMRNIVVTATVLAMTLPGVALAGGKGGGGGKPSESMSLNYSKVEHTYSQQSASKKTGSKTGKTQLHDLSITKKTDKASPN